jgi:hypothetical protein
MPAKKLATVNRSGSAAWPWTPSATDTRVILGHGCRSLRHRSPNRATTGEDRTGRRAATPRTNVALLWPLLAWRRAGPVIARPLLKLCGEPLGCPLESRFTLQVVFPDVPDAVAKRPQLPCVAAPSTYVALEFRNPVLAPRVRRASVLRTLVPEASVYKDRKPQSGNHDIRSTWQRPIILYELVARKCRSDDGVHPAFRGRARAPDPRHDITPLLRREDVHAANPISMAPCGAARPPSDHSGAR